MVDLTKTLPDEIYLQIIQRLVGNPAKDADYLGYMPPELCLVNRRWNEIFTPILYSRYEFDGSLKLVKSLWCFLRTLVSRPDLAEHVRHVSLTTNRLPEPKDGEHPGEYYESLFRDNQRWYKQAMEQAGLNRDFGTPTLNSRAIIALFGTELHGGYQRPLMALILAHCPNLVRLHFHSWEHDRFLEAILGFATADSRMPGATDPPAALAFQNLKTLYIGSRAKRNAKGHIAPSGPTEVSESRPFYRLPKLKELMILDTEIAEDSDDMEATRNTVQHLTLGFTARPYQLDSLLNCSPSLTQLSLSLPGKDAGKGVSLHEELWGMLTPFRGSLEYLDLYQDAIEYKPGMSESEFFAEDCERSFCPSLGRFTKLRQLNATPLMLYGHQCGHAAGEKLCNHLPPNLESLGIYGEDAGWISSFIPRLERELEGVALAGAKRKLKSIVVDGKQRVCDDTLPYQAMRDVAKKHGMLFNEHASDFLFFGGDQTPFAKSTYSKLPVHVLKKTFQRTRASEVIPCGMEVHGFKGELVGRSPYQMQTSTVPAGSYGEDSHHSLFKDDDLQ